MYTGPLHSAHGMGASLDGSSSHSFRHPHSLHTTTCLGCLLFWDNGKSGKGGIVGKEQEVVETPIAAAAGRDQSYVHGAEDQQVAPRHPAPRRCLYDNAKVVTLGRDEEGRTEWNRRMLDFSLRLGFELKLCRPYRAQTKGKVESGVK